MNDLLVAAATSFGFPNPSFDLDAKSRKRLAWVSVLPMIVLSAILALVALSFFFGDHLSGLFFSSDSPVPELWTRVKLLAEGLQAALLPLAVAGLFVAGVQRWSRAEGSWMFVIGLTLAAATLGFGLFGAFSYLVFDVEDAADLRAQTWIALAYSLGFLAIGYFFVAFRAVPLQEEPTAAEGPRLTSATEEAPYDEQATDDQADT